MSSVWNYRVRPQTSFRRETSGGVLKCRLFSQAKKIFNAHHGLFILYKHILKALCEAQYLFVSANRMSCYRSFSLSRNKKLDWKPSSGRNQENETL